MSNYFEELCNHLAGELTNGDVLKVEEAFSSFRKKNKEPQPVVVQKKELPEKLQKEDPSEENKKPTTTKKSTKVKKEEEYHICERIPTRGAKQKCTSRAKNRVVDENGEEHWYCGTEKSGCYKCILNAKNKNLKSTRSISLPKKVDENVHIPDTKSKIIENKKPLKLSEKKSASDAKSKSLGNKITGALNYNARKITVDKEILWMDHQTRVLFDRETEEAYGLLDKDNKTILPLDDKSIRQLDLSSRKIRKQENPKISKDDCNGSNLDVGGKSEEEDLNVGGESEEEEDLNVGGESEEEEDLNVGGESEEEYDLDDDGESEEEEYDLDDDGESEEEED